MSAGVVDGTEEQALAAGGGPETLVPGYPWQVDDLARSLSAVAGRLTATADSLARIEVTGWTGAASVAAHARLGEAPPRWSTAGTALDGAATALTRYAAAFTPARALAAEAASLYERYVASCDAIALVLVPSTSADARDGGGIGQRLALLLAATAHPPTHAAAGAADQLRRAAVETLARARGILPSAGDDAAALVVAATADAPAARTFWQATIRPPGAEESAHHGLDALSFAPGWVGPAAALANAGWFALEGRRGDAAWAAAGAIPFGHVAQGVHAGGEALAAARTFTTKADLLARERADLDGMARRLRADQDRRGDVPLPRRARLRTASSDQLRGASSAHPPLGPRATR